MTNVCKLWTCAQFPSTDVQGRAVNATPFVSSPCLPWGVEESAELMIIHFGRRLAVLSANLVLIGILRVQQILLPHRWISWIDQPLSLQSFKFHHPNPFLPLRVFPDFSILEDRGGEKAQDSRLCFLGCLDLGLLCLLRRESFIEISELFFLSVSLAYTPWPYVYSMWVTPEKTFPFFDCCTKALVRLNGLAREL